MNGDVKPEIIVLSSSAISVFQNLSSPGIISFGSKTDIVTTYSSNDFSACDVNGHGKMDLIVANSYPNPVSLFRNTSSGNLVSFAPKIDLTTGNLRVVRLATGDMNDDGKPDIAIVSNNYGYNDSIAIFKNNSRQETISFDPRISIPYEGGGAGFSMNDIDGDNLFDLVVTSANYSKISVFRHSSNPGSIAFESSTDLTVAGNGAAEAIV